MRPIRREEEGPGQAISSAAAAVAMGDSGGSVVSIDIELISFGGKVFCRPLASSSIRRRRLSTQACSSLSPPMAEHHIQTNHGPVSVAVYGDHDKPALVTYPDIALNHMSCFQGLLFCPEAASLLLHNFCISPPGHELGAASISPNVPVPSVDDLADQVADVLDFFGCLHSNSVRGKVQGRVLGLILVSPVCKAPTWTEWLYSKVMSNFLYYYGMCGLVKDSLLQRYFSKVIMFRPGSPSLPSNSPSNGCGAG